MNYIYILLDPRDSKIRYVGKTNNPVCRLKNHLKEKGHCHRIHWIQELKSIGMKPNIRIIEIIPENKSWETREMYWIKHFREIGHNLVNGTDGGDNPPDCTGMHLVKSEQGRKNIIAALIKRNKSPEMRMVSRQNGKRNAGYKQTPKEIERKRQWMLGRKMHTNEFRQKLSERNKNRSYDHAKMREQSIAAWKDPIKGKKMRNALIERNRKRRGQPTHRKQGPEEMRKRAKKLWDNPIKAFLAREKLIERNKKRAHQTKIPR